MFVDNFLCCYFFGTLIFFRMDLFQRLYRRYFPLQSFFEVMAILMDKTIAIMIDISLSIACLVMGDRKWYDDEREIEELRFSEGSRPSTDDAEIGMSITQSHRRRIGQ